MLSSEVNSVIKELEWRFESLSSKITRNNIDTEIEKSLLEIEKCFETISKSFDKLKNSLIRRVIAGDYKREKNQILMKELEFCKQKLDPYMDSNNPFIIRTLRELKSSSHNVEENFCPGRILDNLSNQIQKVVFENTNLLYQRNINDPSLMKGKFYFAKVYHEFQGLGPIMNVKSQRIFTFKSKNNILNITSFNKKEFLTIRSSIKIANFVNYNKVYEIFDFQNLGLIFCCLEGHIKIFKISPKSNRLVKRIEFPYNSTPAPLEKYRSIIFQKDSLLYTADILSGKARYKLTQEKIINYKYDRLTDAIVILFESREIKIFQMRPTKLGKVIWEGKLNSIGPEIKNPHLIEIRFKNNYLVFREEQQQNKTVYFVLDRKSDNQTLSQFIFKHKQHPLGYFCISNNFIICQEFNHLLIFDANGYKTSKKYQNWVYMDENCILEPTNSDDMFLINPTYSVLTIS